MVYASCGRKGSRSGSDVEGETSGFPLKE